MAETNQADLLPSTGELVRQEELAEFMGKFPEIQDWKEILALPHQSITEVVYSLAAIAVGPQENAQNKKDALYKKYPILTGAIKVLGDRGGDFILGLSIISTQKVRAVVTEELTRTIGLTSQLQEKWDK